MEEVMTLIEASTYLKVNKYTIYRLAQKGRIPAFKVGKIWRFKRDKMEVWMEENSNTNNRIKNKKRSRAKLK